MGHIITELNIMIVENL